MTDIMRFANPLKLGVIGLALCLWLDPAAAEVVAVVSSKSTVTMLSKNQVADLFLGKLHSFPNGEPAIPVDQDEASSVRDEFYSRFTGKSAAQIKAYWSKIIFTGRGQPPKSVSSSAEVKRLLVENPNTIGYLEADRVDGSVKVLVLQ
ncbi:MAG: phosphate ABC transporter substrate-binding protein [Thiobacillaceae bacterium]